MREQYDGWIESSHRAVAVCNDCHAPHDLVGKYATKAVNGFWHSFGVHDAAASTSRSEIGAAQPSRSPRARAGTATATSSTRSTRIAPRSDERIDCVRCHGSVGHLH